MGAQIVGEGRIGSLELARIPKFRTARDDHAVFGVASEAAQGGSVNDHKVISPNLKTSVVVRTDY